MHLPAHHQMTFVPFRFIEGRIFSCPIPIAHLSLSVELHGLQSSDIGRQSELNAIFFRNNKYQAMVLGMVIPHELRFMLSPPLNLQSLPLADFEKRD
jgi:hypothetical protein